MMIDHMRETRYLTACQEEIDIYESMLPCDHKLCQLVDVVDFEAFRPIVESGYSAKGQPTGYAMIVFKLEVLKYFYNLSDRAVVERAATDVAFRWFLRLPMGKLQLDHTLMTRFRGRMGKERYAELFHQVVAQARQQGLVKDQLRLKDATHVLANISIPSTTALLAQMREHLLGIIRKLDAEAADGYALAVQSMRERTKDASDVIRLNERVELLGDVVDCARSLLNAKETFPAAILKDLQTAVELAEKIIEQKKEKKAKREIRSIVDPDAMRGKHGAYYDGYILDVCMDADSEIITSMAVLPAGGSESQSAVALIAQERSAHGNSPRELSIDGAGFSGPMIRQLESTEMNMQVITPPKKLAGNDELGQDQFELIKSEDGSTHVQCPQGQVSRYSQRDRETTVYRFPKEVCESCLLYKLCCRSSDESPFGRTVRKNDYAEEYDRIRRRSTTEHFQHIRKIHPAVERKLNECANHHGARHARYRGLDKVPIQMYGVGMVANLKRIVTLCVARLAALPKLSPAFC
jgi:IS5 family transposase